MKIILLSSIYALALAGYGYKKRYVKTKTFKKHNYIPSSLTPSVYVSSEFIPAEYIPSEFVPGVYKESYFKPAEYVKEEFIPAQYTPSQFKPAIYKHSGFTPEIYVPSSNEVITITKEVHEKKPKKSYYG